MLNDGHAALHALAGIGHRLLIGALRGAQPLQTDLEAGLVHHGKHAGETLILFSNQIPNRAAVVAIGHHTGGAAVNTQLVFDRNRVSVVTLT